MPTAAPPDPPLPPDDDRSQPPVPAVDDGDGDHGRDPVTSREGLELELMDDGASEEGEQLGEHNL